MKLLVLLAIFFSPFPLYSQNLIVNPGAESNPRGTGWTVLSSGPTACGVAPSNTFLNWTMIPDGSANYPTAHGGTRTFFSGCSATAPNGPFEIYQDIDLSSYSSIIAAGGLATIFSGYIQTPISPQSDAGRFIVDFYNATNNVIAGSYVSAYQSFSGGSGTGWVFHTNTRTAPTTATRVRIRMQTTVGVTPAINAYFDDLSFTVASTLPLTLTSFIGETRTQYNELKWITSQEMNTSHFIIERSTTGTWSEIGRLDAAGNSSSDLIYTFSDQNPEMLSLYRLKMVDIDGRFTYSNVVKLNRSADGQFEVKVYPNPAVDVLNVSITFAQEVEMKIIGANGQLLQQKKLPPQNNHSINVSNLRSGVYMLQLKDNMGRSVTTRFTKR